MSEIIVTVFGTSKARPGDSEFELAEALGTLLAKNGYTIANGGYDGTMYAAARGAASMGGKVIGVTCTAFKSSANEFVTQEIPTDALEGRLRKLVQLGEAYVVLPGGTGTLLELAEVWELKNKRFFAADKPVIILGEFWKPLVELMKQQDEKCDKCLSFAADPDEAVEIINRILI
ncbi:LOG family protein ORF6 in fasciation locus [Anaerohalosphaera lusitana]|uniref:LOG family protein ORF6 in fasciation locus n=1 Tax=Anaerohalosphaera lusitana TaxID=1936003 RepID=A0A1U9NKP7_9BACT|nr:LOG family protein [Anaerohalosphaera lusitana]AQT68367.1 LOG family protein ORF6 in fasciation locus [Anaerohalosphaera lusitana]